MVKPIATLSTLDEEGTRTPRSDSGDAPEEHVSTGPHVHYAANVNTEPPPHNLSLNPPESVTGFSQSESELPISPVLRRRSTRVSTFKTVDDYDAFETARPGWQPGAEPGFDPNKADGGHGSMPMLSAPCEITVVDFSHKDMVMHHFDNETFIEFLKKPQEKWSKCRWININGLSWDVIQACGQSKGLHKLAIEDIMNTRNRTKADWYPNHAFVVLTLQKLVRLIDPDDDECDDANSTFTGRSTKKGWRSMKRWFGASKKGRQRLDSEESTPRHAGHAGHEHTMHHHNGFKTQPTGLSDLPDDGMFRTLARYHASPNEARTQYMEEHSSLASRNLAVSAEQVSIFLTSDNTVISFFEMSANDVERPILTRLSTPGTILRQSCDASLLMQAIMDAIIDLAIPVTAVYTDVIGDIELDVLLSPNVKQSKSLYICISEINKMLTFLNPIDNLVNVLRDHRTSMSQEVAAKELQNPASGVIVTPMTHIYLGDVLDHCVIITESMVQMKHSADNLIDLIFNTISAAQNESMKMLTISTIIFLPMTFLTGYFGQNFHEFADLDKGLTFFWSIAIPVVCVTILITMSSWIREHYVTYFQRRNIVAIRRKGRKNKKS